MGLFSKDKCDLCGKESRSGISNYYDGDEAVKICNQCIDEKFHCDGLRSLELFGLIQEEVDMNALKRYQEYYERVAGDPQNRNTDSSDITIGTECYFINSKFTLLPPYKDVVILNKDVKIIALTTLKNNDTKNDIMMISYFLDSDIIPQISVVTAAKSGLFSSKAKKYREGLNTLFNENYHDLKYPVMEAGELKKMVKKTDDLDLGSISRDKLLNKLDNAQRGKGEFGTKEILGLCVQSDMAWAIEFNKSMGYDVKIVR
jgi:hypothetical protein